MAGRIVLILRGYLPRSLELAVRWTLSRNGNLSEQFQMLIGTSGTGKNAEIFKKSHTSSIKGTLRFCLLFTSHQQQFG